MSEQSRSSALPLFIGGALALLLVLGFVKYRFDRLEEHTFARIEDARKRDTSTKVITLDEAPSLPYREIYVPVDVSANARDGKKVPLEATLVLRNTSKRSPLYVKKVELYGSDGQRIRRVVNEPFELAPFASVEFLAHESGEQENGQDRDDDGQRSRRHASDAPPSHFIVHWATSDDVAAPLIETVMVGPGGDVLYARSGRDLENQTPRLGIQTGQERPRHEAPRQALPRRERAPSASELNRAAERHAAAPPYELIRYDSNMGLRPKNP